LLGALDMFSTVAIRLGSMIMPARLPDACSGSGKGTA
jgi:hypothetical protein